jgi:RNA polymerase sigma-70 factor (ECF subfamily)
VVVRDLLERGRLGRDRRAVAGNAVPTDTGASSVSGRPPASLTEEELRSGVFPEPIPGSVRLDGSVEPPLPPSPESFLELFHEYERYVASIGTRILGHNNGVDDLVQEVFLVIYQEFHKLRGLSSTKAWLATIATRLAWRQRGRPWLYSKLSLAQVEEVTPLESTEASPELQADLAVLLERLRSMPSSLREPWLLRFIDGETLPRIAELCDCSQSTVQRRLREAGEVMLGTRRPEAVTAD